MTHTPPIPAGNQSPYPIQEPPHPPVEAQVPAIVEDAPSASDRLRDLPLAAIGTAVGLGVALIGGVLFGLRRGKPNRRAKRKV